MTPRQRLILLIKEVLRTHGVTYIDCNGDIVGDCSTCGGGGEGGPVTVATSFNASNNRLTVTVNGVSSNVLLSFDTGDITTNTPTTINGVTFATGTTLQTILNNIAALAHPPANITNNNSAFTWNVTTQAGNIPSSPTLVDNGDGTFTFTRGNGSPPETLSIDLTPVQDDFIDLTFGTTTLTLSHTPSNRRHILLFRNGAQNRGFSVSGTTVTLSLPIGMSPGGAATEDISVFYFY